MDRSDRLKQAGVVKQSASFRRHCNWIQHFGTRGLIWGSAIRKQEEGRRQYAVWKNSVAVLHSSSSRNPLNKRASFSSSSRGKEIDSLCTRNRIKMMTILDSEEGKVVATVPIGQGVDGNGFDAGSGLAFSSNGEGTTDRSA